ncbi:TadE family type IV pilus minor pilin [Arthrobacter sp. ISL-72]|uniref:TadE family type IV pilus minor pilin n=1 Tax=Arthrobacter sp. ISL-72 TaxID=2819114 RepID=UPI00203537B7|nr:TadE family type IV pilus minor pilin [Arthrobacter sp. ISL-72]
MTRRLHQGAPPAKEPGGSGKDRGAVTAEFAVALPAVLLLLALLLAGSAAGITQLRLEEAARAGARALARGEDAGAVDGIVRQLAGASASSSVVAEGEWLSVTVFARVSGPVGSIVPWTLSARALARSETPESAGVRSPVLRSQTQGDPAREEQTRETQLSEEQRLAAAAS